MPIETRNISNSAVTASKLAANAVTAAKLSSTMATGFIDLPLTSWRISNAANTDYALLAATAAIGSGGVGGSDATPSLIRVNTTTDKQARIIWAASASDDILNDFMMPPDLDASANVTFKILAAMAGATDTPVMAVSWFENGVGAYAADTNAGGNTAAITGTSLAVYSVTIAAADVAAAPTHVAVSLVPGAHTTDALHLYGAWVEYTRV